MIDEFKSAPYLDAKQSCDFLMKGGVTSGIVYPMAICRLAKDFRFRNIGGTSAGALAAALAAAAEYSRQIGKSANGFQMLADIPQFLGTGKNLVNLFQPRSSTAPLFGVALKWIETSSIVAVGRTLCHTYRLQAGLVALGALAFLAGAGFSIEAATNTSATVEAVRRFALVGILGVAGGTAAAAGGMYGILRAISRIVSLEIPRNHFGMCTGMPGVPPDANPALTP
jgi:hypothetical protein